MSWKCTYEKSPLGPAHVEMMLKATDDLPLNFGFSGKGNTSDPETSITNVLRSGASGFKLHEDWGTTPSAIDACLNFADAHDVQVTIHTVSYVPLSNAREYLPHIP